MIAPRSEPTPDRASLDSDEIPVVIFGLVLALALSFLALLAR